MLNIDVGCGGKGTKYDDFIGLDIWPHSGITRHPDQYVKQDVLADGLPWPDDIVDCAVCIHVVEHMTRDDALKMAHEIRRVLKPGRPAVFACPDLRLMAQRYVDRDAHFYNKQAKADGTLVWNGPTLADRFLDSILGMGPHGHRYAYDCESLKQLLEDAHFMIGRDAWPPPAAFVQNASKRTDHEIMIEVYKPQ